MHLFMKERKKKRQNVPKPIRSTCSLEDCPCDPKDPNYMLEEPLHDPNDGSQNESNKSVISHLMSQLKIGMDLTKVTLPTFILEKRSLLEFYADLFAYPDLFLDIAKKTTPVDRMMACLRFYLSTFSAGRESTVCKKPYNPILGEHFRCYYSVGDNTNRPPNELKPYEGDVSVQKDPLYWMNADDLSFIGEQVSHHPPVSACHAVHHELKIKYDGHVWTKSKFYGLSVGVEMIGPGTVTLEEFDEQYEMDFPNVVCRSILTIPWAEVVGDTHITCAKTGFSAKVKFHPKPFYRGYPNRISAEVFSKTSKTPLCTIEGKWDDVLTTTYPDGRKEVLFDKSTVIRAPKRVRKLVDQDSQESRRLWFNVTQNLLNHNGEEATTHKSQLEQKQREEAGMREKNGIKYHPKYFVLDGTNWVYKHRNSPHHSTIEKPCGSSVSLQKVDSS